MFLPTSDGANLLDVKEVIVTDMAGKPYIYLISKIPATYAREIVAKWTLNSLPRIGEYDVNHEMMMKLMSYVAIPSADKTKAPLRLTTRELVDNHVPDLLTLEKLEKEMGEYNWGFFPTEALSNLKERFLRIFSIFLTQILTASLQQSSKNTSPPSTN